MTTIANIAEILDAPAREAPDRPALIIDQGEDAVGLLLRRPPGGDRAMGRDAGGRRDRAGTPHRAGRLGWRPEHGGDPRCRAPWCGGCPDEPTAHRRRTRPTRGGLRVLAGRRRRPTAITENSQRHSAATTSSSNKPRNQNRCPSGRLVAMLTRWSSSRVARRVCRSPSPSATAPSSLASRRTGRRSTGTARRAPPSCACRRSTSAGCSGFSSRSTPATRPSSSRASTQADGSPPCNGIGSCRRS